MMQWRVPLSRASFHPLFLPVVALRTKSTVVRALVDTAGGKLTADNLI